MFLSSRTLLNQALKTSNNALFQSKMDEALKILTKRKENAQLKQRTPSKGSRSPKTKSDAFLTGMLSRFEKKYNSEYDLPSESQVQSCKAQMNVLEPRFEFGAPQYEIFEEKDVLPNQKILPEIIFLGKCNSGKSTLLNNLITNPKARELTKLARASKVAGYTKMLNVYNISDKFRIVDSPGYGVKGTPEQGDVTMNYLLKRKNLRRVYLLASALTGLNHYDSAIVDFLVEHGIPFEVVWTKMDKVFGESEHILSKNIENSGVLEMPVKPRFFFINSKTSKNVCTKRYGVDNLKVSIMQACSLL